VGVPLRIQGGLHVSVEGGITAYTEPFMIVGRPDETFLALVALRRKRRVQKETSTLAEAIDAVIDAHRR
jgi:hypothetical protein